MNTLISKIFSFTKTVELNYFVARCLNKYSYESASFFVKQLSEISPVHQGLLRALPAINFRKWKT